MIEVERLTKRGGGRAAVSDARSESGTIVEATDFAALGAALHGAGVAMDPAHGDRRLVQAEPEVVARVAMANDVVLRRLAPVED